MTMVSCEAAFLKWYKQLTGKARMRKSKKKFGPIMASLKTNKSCNKCNKLPYFNSEQSYECIDFTMMCFFVFVSVYSITSRNNAPISNYGDSFRCKSEYPWGIIKVKMILCNKQGFISNKFKNTLIHQNKKKVFNAHVQTKVSKHFKTYLKMCIYIPPANLIIHHTYHKINNLQASTKICQFKDKNVYYLPFITNKNQLYYNSTESVRRSLFQGMQKAATMRIHWRGNGGGGNCKMVIGICDGLCVRSGYAAAYPAYSLRTPINLSHKLSPPYYIKYGMLTMIHFTVVF
ncbi:Uncharacterized protein FWK35_00003718 [Aphis craccivora]|uniref:Uncharacterized protein n=1 Tax=Aphis craccivora TaxID=307492 RepID=A0A6G0Z6Y3_APHCR|nr:Uncharacterized protein FWK35_00003718 [Aphis craccivora]